MPVCLPNDSKAMLVIGSERCRVVSQDVRKNLFVVFTLCCLERRRKQGLGDSLPPASEFHICTDDTDMIESVCVGGKWGHALKTNDCVISCPHSDMKNVA